MSNDDAIHTETVPLRAVFTYEYEGLTADYGTNDPQQIAAQDQTNFEDVENRVAFVSRAAGNVKVTHLVAMYRELVPLAAREGDMGDQTKLVLVKESDGAIIVRIQPNSLELAHEIQVQFAVPSASVRSPKTHAALLALWQAMQEELV